MALKRLGVPFQHWRLSEWDVNATKSYKAIHYPDDHTDYSADKTKEDLIRVLNRLGISTDGKEPLTLQKIQKKSEVWLRETYNNFRATKNIGSVMNREGRDLGIKNTDKYTFILTYSFPCQDLSLAGHQAGMSKGSGTRSGLLWEVERLLLECKELGAMPDVLMMENVDAIHNKKNMSDFQKWLDFLNSIGYHTYWQDMNSKNYGVAQNRERCFAISLLSDKPYIFPKPIPLKKRIKDYLEKNVDESFYINSERAQNLIIELIENGKLIERERE